MRRRRPGRPFKILFRFLLINIAFFIVTSPFVVLYGPFANLKKNALEAVATSMHGKYLNYFISKQEIDKLLADSFGGAVAEKFLKFRIVHNPSIKLVQIDGARFKGYLLEVKDPSRIKIGLAKDLGTNGQTTSEIAREYDAVAAVNAGGFIDPSGTGTGRLPVGVIIHDGNFVDGGNVRGYVPLVGLTNQGDLVTGSYTVGQMKRLGVTEGISFYPSLIVNGEKQITHGDGGWGVGPRTAIGQRKDGTILLLVIDGRQPGYSIGATLLDVQNILYKNGAYVAANLDGGSSATMYYNGKVINRPADLLGERSIPTAIIVQ
ncbi:MAG: phosphodiester glycosidase family protein [Peptococcaceae bacterium]|nr:phosphodiester glycosidase family protein [Peptococcaceae bacterium]